MGSRGAAAALAFLLVVMLAASSVADAACSNDLSGLAPCYPAVTQGGNQPSSACCGMVKGWGLPCLCTVLSKYANQMPANIDMNKVVALPKDCAMTVPAGYSCAGYSFPS